MVSIAIIGLLMALVMININNTKQKNRDARRIMDVNQIAKALELFVTNNQRYPVSANPSGDIITSNDVMSTALETAKFIPNTPVDPLNSNPYLYTYISDGTTFSVGFCLETTGIQGYAQGCGNAITP